jgi:resuscitation-promoting factor RpfB
MKFPHWLAFAAIIFLSTGQSPTSSTVTIIDNDKIISLQTDERNPLALLNQAGLTLDPNDSVLLNGLRITTLDQPITNYPITLQIRRAANMLIITPDGQEAIQTSAFTTGEALIEAGILLHESDRIEPSVNSRVVSPMTVNYVPSDELMVSVNGKSVKINSIAKKVGEALAEVGIPLVGLDYSIPSENEPLPSDGQIKVVRVSESVLLAQKPIPFESVLQASANVPLDQTQILQPGENGLTVQRIRIRYEDGKEISRMTEAETLVRPPKTRLLGYGTKIEIKTTVVDGVEIEYWRAVQMYATSYSPCRSGGDRCYSGTASGQTLRKGMVGMQHSWYLSMQGQRLYIPGYGFSSVEDVCGGCVGKPWIDLGYSDNDYEHWSSWVTVYFLTPVPANVIQVLE